MIGKVQSDVISFEEFHEQHPNETIVIPNESGFDGVLLYQLGLTSVLETLGALATYVAQKVLDGRFNHGTVTMDFEDGFKIEIPLSECKNAEKLRKRIELAHEVFLKMKEGLHE